MLLGFIIQSHCNSRVVGIHLQFWQMFGETQPMQVAMKPSTCAGQALGRIPFATGLRLEDEPAIFWVSIHWSMVVHHPSFLPSIHPLNSMAFFKQKIKCWI